MLIRFSSLRQINQHRLLKTFILWPATVILTFYSAIYIPRYQSLVIVALLWGMTLIYFTTRKRVSFYLWVFIVIIFLEFANYEIVLFKGRSLQFFLSFLVFALFFFEVLTRESSLHIPIISKVNFYIIGFYLFSTLAMIFSLNPERSLKNLTTLLQIPFYYICAEILFRRNNLIKHLNISMMVMGTAIAIYVIINYFAIANLIGHFVAPSKSLIYKFLLTNTNMMAYTLLICLQFPLFYLSSIDKRVYRILAYIVITLMTISIYITHSRTGQALILVTYFTFFFRVKKVALGKLIPAAVLFVIVFIGFTRFYGDEWYRSSFYKYEKNYFVYHFSKHRGATWQVAIKEFIQHPFFGVGQEALIMDLYPTYSFTHNTYLNILAERGIFTFAFYILLLIYFFRLSRQLEKSSGPNHRPIFLTLTSVLIIHYLFSLFGDFQNSKLIWLFFSIITAEKLRLLKAKSSIRMTYGQRKPRP